MNPTPIHPKLAEITERIIERSRPTREKYLAKIRSAKQMGRWSATNSVAATWRTVTPPCPKASKSKCFRIPFPT